MPLLQGILRAFMGTPATLQAFRGSGGAAALVSPRNFQAHVLPSRQLGRPPTPATGAGGGAWVAPYSSLLSVINQTNGNPQLLARALGFPDPNHFVGAAPANRIMLAHIPAPAEHNLSVPTSETAGANTEFTPGGLTSGGVQEAIINRVSAESRVMMPSDQDGLISHAEVRFFDMENFVRTPPLGQWLATRISHAVDESRR